MTEQDRSLCKQSIMRHEGMSPRPVPDTNGTIVLGYGWNPCRTPMTEGQALFILDQQLDSKLNELTRAWSLFPSQPAPVQRVLVEMSYQLGVQGLMLFTRMLHCLAVGDRAGAAREVLNSTLATQTPARARDYAHGLMEDE